MSVLRFTAPLPPSLNHSHIEISVKGRRMRVPKPETLAFKQEVGLIACNAAQLTGWQPADRMKIEVGLVFNRRGADVDNRHKVLQDAIAVALGFNDSKFRDVRVYEIGIDRKNPRCEVTIDTLE